MSHSHPSRKGILEAIGAAVLFGASAPLSKRLLPEISPQILAGFLYLGSGLGLVVFRTLKPPSKTGEEAPLTRKDVPWLAASVLAGGIVGPLLLMLGLQATPASLGSLLLNLEGVFTALLAWFVFRENFDRRIALGMAAILGGAVILSWTGRPPAGIPWGSFAVAGACLSWAIDNNLTRKISGSDPVQIAMIKGLCAGTVNTVLGLALGGRIPSLSIAIAAGTIGFLGYGVSLVLFVVGLRNLGTARTSAYFSLAPFVGTLLALAVLGERVTGGLLLAGGLMGLGLWLHLTERHEHQHQHELMEHEHPHIHDEHHQHAHSPNDPPGEPHTHPHRHTPLTHSHPHYPDLHHQHKH